MSLIDSISSAYSSLRRVDSSGGFLSGVMRGYHLCIIIDSAALSMKLVVLANKILRRRRLLRSHVRIALCNRLLLRW